MIIESRKRVTLPVLKVTQPIGDFYIGKMSAKDLISISFFDIRRLDDAGNYDKYLGIQRKVSDSRVAEIAKYVTLKDATFPTAVILAVQGRCVELNPVCDDDRASDFFEMVLENKPGELDDDNTVLFRAIARVLDGQHRIIGLRNSKQSLDDFYISICIFVDADMADQSSIFATVNLAQTKVNHSLVYDLQSYSKTRSPEKTCHSVTVVLDQKEKSPFHHRIKRLGVATDGRFGEVITQATVVKSLLPYITRDPIGDRDIGKRKGKWSSNEPYNEQKLIFRHWFIDNQDDRIAEQMMHYFEAIRRRWPDAWDDLGSGMMLARTNGFRGLMRFLRPAYLELAGNNRFVKMKSFKELLDNINIEDSDFTTVNFPPGGAGELGLFKKLMEESKLGDYS